MPDSFKKSDFGNLKSYDNAKFFCVRSFGIIPHLSDILCPKEYKSKIFFQMKYRHITFLFHLEK